MASSIEKVKKELTCPVCKEILKKPKLLGCSHRVCKECLRDEITKQNVRPEDIIKCPCCRFTIDISDKIGDKPKKDWVDFFVDDSLTATTAQHVQAFNTDTCVQHDDLFCIYCRDCNTPLCFACYKQNHRKHKTYSLKKEAESQRTEYDDLLEEYSGKSETLAKGDLTANASQLKQYYEDAAEKVKREYQKVQKLLRDMEKQVTDEIKSTCDRKVKDFCKSEKEQVDKFVQNLKEVCSNPSNVAILSEDVEEQIEELKSQQIQRPKIPKDLVVKAVDLNRAEQCLANIKPSIPFSSSQTFAVPASTSNESLKRKGTSQKNEPKCKRIYPPQTPSPCSSSPTNSPLAILMDP